VNQIEECLRVQVRQSNDVGIIEEYAEAYKAGADMPPIVVYQESGTERYIVSDGHHRLKAAQKAELTTIEVDLVAGDESDALENALGSNHRHGLRLKKADRRRGVSLLMTDTRLKKKYRTDQDRADLLGVSIRAFRVYKAEWRNSTGGSVKEQAAKGSAQRSAVQKTSKSPKNNTNQDNGLSPDAADCSIGKSNLSDAESGDLPAMSIVMSAHLRDVKNALEILSRNPYTGKDFVALVGASRIGPTEKKGAVFARQLADVLRV
jgi:uncharacterized ParB-like nuclease family protein